MNEKIHPQSEDLFAYRDGELTPEKRAAIEAHVMGCSVCRSLIDQVSSLEAELRQSPDLSPTGYLDHLHESVRSRIAVAASEGSAVEAAPAPEAVRERRRAPRDEERKERRERGRVKEAPSMSWAAVLGTASAAAAVLVVVVILIRQGPYQRMVMPTPKTTAVTRAPAREETTLSRVATVGAREGGSASADLKVTAKEESRALRDEAHPGEKAPKPVAQSNVPAPAIYGKGEGEELKDKLAKRADEIVGGAPQVGSGKIAAENERYQSAPDSDVRARMSQKPAASPRAFNEAQVAPGPAYEAILKRYGLPPVWNGARVSPSALANAEPELRSLYVSGNAGTDSSRVRLYIAEAVRLRYAPGDAPLYDEIVHHYRRVIEMSGPDSEIGKIAAERLRSLEQ